MELEIQVFRREGKTLKNREEQVYRNLKKRGTT